VLSDISAATGGASYSVVTRAAKTSKMFTTMVTWLSLAEVSRIRHAYFVSMGTVVSVVPLVRMPITEIVPDGGTTN
jgi:hypothetical protein